MDAGLETIGLYVTCRQNTMVQYIATQPIFNIAMEEDQRPISTVLLRLWDHVVIWFGYGVEAGAEGFNMDLGYCPI